MLVLGPEGFEVLRANLEFFTNVRFEYLIDASAGIIGLKPGSPMTSSISASQPSTNGAASTKKSVAKVARPKNAFMIYRLDHHASVLAAHPGMHNNDISKIIGNMWSRESQAVKDEYKQKAEDEKRQHAIAHPGYQYQPRKPSEKKKRMTKNKLAKLAAVSRSTDATTDATTVPAQQNEQTTVDSFTPPYQNNTPQLTILDGTPLATFDVFPGFAGDDGLHDQLALFNSQQPQLPANAGMVAVAAGPLVSDDSWLCLPAEDSLPTTDDGAEAQALAEWASDPTTTSEGARTQDPFAEQYRQEELDKELESLGLYFDVEGASGASGVPDDFAPADTWQPLYTGEA
ncbi:mating type locus 1-2 [Dothistroma septosporum NZE10]|uniref:Mating type locus 1-2 n=2 Tax=Dothistroma septosporum TaxID=64363 RepID=M2Y1B2_DOTSN|nr:mating type locus 1-2 [Dothistroma septosporum NZE10]